MENSKSNRRSFIKSGIVALGSLVAVPLAAREKSKNTVKMLTPDGKLVEVNSDVLKKASKKKVTSREILDWRTLKG